ncbi:uncharacterized protein [Anas acuta]|uniref:uncharacterized protein isoform X2 n=1 Tax=Anas acuta TaxID=28680 RepID=UPI0035C92503
MVKTFLLPLKRCMASINKRLVLMPPAQDGETNSPFLPTSSSSVTSPTGCEVPELVHEKDAGRDQGEMDCGSPDAVSCLSWREGEHLSKAAVPEGRAHQDCLLTCTPGWKRRGEEQQKKMPLGREEERNRIMSQHTSAASTCPSYSEDPCFIEDYMAKYLISTRDTSTTSITLHSYQHRKTHERVYKYQLFPLPELCGHTALSE